jgi:hypothetical protein
MFIRGNNKGINQLLFMVFSPNSLVSGFVYCFQRVTRKQASNLETGDNPKLRLSNLNTEPEARALHLLPLH